MNASIRTYSGSHTELPSVFSIPTEAHSRFYGEVCGLFNLSIYGTLDLGSTGYTCGSGAAEFKISHVIVQPGGRLVANSGQYSKRDQSTSNTTIVLRGEITVMEGGYIDPIISINPAGNTLFSFVSIDVLTDSQK